MHAYVQSLTQPVIRGVAAGEQLSVEWPRARDQFAAAPHVDLFVLAAFLEPQKFAERLLATIHKSAPPVDRDDQIASLSSKSSSWSAWKNHSSSQAARRGSRSSASGRACLQNVTASRGGAA